MADNIATLVRMANQIADFYKPYTEAEAVAGVREHVTSFWTPQMRKDLAAHVAADGKGLRPAVVAAFTKASPAESPTHKVVEDAKELGEPSRQPDLGRAIHERFRALGGVELPDVREPVRRPPAFDE